jgi:hypothetical protein
LVDYLTKVKSWMDVNPNEGEPPSSSGRRRVRTHRAKQAWSSSPVFALAVISMIIVNSDSIPPSTYASAFDRAGVTSVTYKPTSAVTTIDAWPTLGSMIENGGRMVVFMDYNADYTSVNWIIDGEWSESVDWKNVRKQPTDGESLVVVEFSNMWEDAYDVTDQEFACNVNRSTGSPTTTLSMTNHFLDVYGNILGINAWLPDKDKLNETNAETGYGSIGQGASNCVGLWGKPPNHILLDFYDSNGNAPFVVAANLNGVSAPTNEVTVSTDSKGSNAQASGAAQSTAGSTGSMTGTSSGTAAKVTSSSLTGASGMNVPNLLGMMGVVLGGTIVLGLSGGGLLTL